MPNASFMPDAWIQCGRFIGKDRADIFDHIERLIIQNLVNTDPFLSAHCTPVLYEYEPASADKVLEGCLRSLDNCQM